MKSVKLIFSTNRIHLIFKIFITCRIKKRILKSFYICEYQDMVVMVKFLFETKNCRVKQRNCRAKCKLSLQKSWPNCNGTSFCAKLWKWAAAASRWAVQRSPGSSRAQATRPCCMAQVLRSMNLRFEPEQQTL